MDLYWLDVEIDRIPLVYVAAPYRANTEYQLERNIRVAEIAALEIWKRGAAVMCPHKNTAHFGGALGLGDETWLKGDLAMIKRCDALFVTGDISEGVRQEIEFAKNNDIPVFDSYGDVDDFIWMYIQT